MKEQVGGHVEPEEDEGGYEAEEDDGRDGTGQQQPRYQHLPHFSPLYNYAAGCSLGCSLNVPFSLM